MSTLNLGVIGNCTYGALVDRGRAHRVVLPAAVRRGPSVLQPDRRRRECRCGILRRRAPRSGGHRAALPREHRDSRNGDGGRRREPHRRDRLRAAVPHPRAHVPPHHARTQDPSEPRLAAHPHPGAPAFQLRRPCARRDPRVEPHPLRAHQPGAAAQHQRSHRLRARRDPVPARGAGEPDPRTRRDAGRRRRGDRARVRGEDRHVLAALDPASGAAVRVAGGGHPCRHHAEALRVRGDRRDHRGDDHEHPGSRGHRPELGLSLLLAAGLVLRGAGAQQPRRGRDDGGLPPLPEQHHQRQRGGGLERAPAAGVRDRARAPPHRAHRHVARGLSRHGSGARREPGVRARPARRLRQRSARGVPGVLRHPAPGPSGSRGARTPREDRRAGVSPCTTSPMPACGSCAPWPGCTRRRA